jgi:nucleotide-binding universal stress UspA family protein
MQRILVALDGSPRQQEVLDAALALADKLGSRLILFHSVSLPLPLPTTALAVPPDQIGNILLDTSKKALEEVARSVPAERLERQQVEIGVPWRAVCDAARSDGVDLVIIGSHGYGGFDRLLGTTAAKIVDHAPCSVLVVRPKD